MDFVAGTILTSDGFTEGGLGIEDGMIAELSKTKPRAPVATGVVIPSFCNAHTHLGDAFIRIELKGTVEELVAPPHGLKHRLLAEASEEDVVSGIRAAVDTMLQGGTGSFWDFRETGVEGAKMLYRACLGTPVKPLCLGRPKRMEYDAEEVRALLRVCDGLGISSARDWAASDLQKLALDARRAGKLFAIHCSEVVRENIDAVLDLKPAFLVHMLAATDDDLERCVDAKVPIVICPRSNAFFGMLPDIPLMLSKGVTLLLGTDNAMLSAPSMLREVEFAFRAARLSGYASPVDIVNMAIRGRKGLSELDNLGLQTGERTCLTVLDMPPGEDPYSAILRATQDDVALVWLGEQRWQRQGKQLVQPGPRRRSPDRRRAGRQKSRRRKPGPPRA